MTRRTDVRARLRVRLSGSVAIALAVACTPHTPTTRQPGAPSIQPCARAEAPRDRAVTQIPFGLFSAHEDDFQPLRAAGFTMVGPWYGDGATERRLDAAHRAGLGVIVPVGYDHDRYLREHRIDWSAEETVSALAAQVIAVAEHPAVHGWYLRPEELRYWSAAELAYVRVAAKAIREHDPHGRPILAYQANNRTADQLTAIVAELDVLSKGTYTNYTRHRRARAWVGWSVNESVRASQRAPGGRTVWAVPEMFEEPVDASPEQIAVWTKHDVYASLVAGARGVLVFSGFRRQGFSSYDAYIAGYKAVASELNGPRGLAAALTSPRCTGPRPVPTSSAPAVSFATEYATHSVPAIASRTTADAAHWYLLTVNSSERAIDVVLEGVDETATAIVGPPLTRSDPPGLRLSALGVSVVVGDNHPVSAVSVAHGTAPPRSLRAVGAEATGPCAPRHVATSRRRPARR